VIKRSVGAMGHVLWNTTRGDYAWFGPGSRLHLVFGDSLVTIDHNVADGTYDSERDARAALDRFLAEFTHDAL
jgi:hypothetical protein